MGGWGERRGVGGEERREGGWGRRGGRVDEVSFGDVAATFTKIRPHGPALDKGGEMTGEKRTSSYNICLCINWTVNKLHLLMFQ